MTTITFWVCAAALAYVYAGFGLLVVAWGFVRRRTVRQGPGTPRVSLIIAAYNEEQGIREKLGNCLELDYPKDALEIIVGSDGSDDATESIVASYATDDVQLLSLPRRGKIHVLNEAVERATGEILVFSDANTLYHPKAIRALVRNFADPDVGGVCGNQQYVRSDEEDSSGAGESLYWTWDKWLKSMQSRTGSIVSADGAIYAIRRELYRKPPSAAVTDDFAISTAVIELGYRLVFDADAVGWERPTGAASREFGRRVRVMNRGMNGVRLRRRLLNPFRYGFYSLVLFSHKVLRRLAPVLLLGLFATSLLSAGEGVLYLAAAVGQTAFYLLAIVGGLARSKAAGQTRILSTPFYFCLANAAALVALGTFLGGRRIEHWNPARADAVPSAGPPAR